MSKEVKKFDVSGSMFEQLSESVTSNQIALNELIKNAYDAGAAHVTLNLTDDETHDDYHLIISDDGSGFTDETIDALLNIGSSGKKYGKLIDIDGKLKRRIQGQKGLGLYAAFRMGKVATFETIHDGTKKSFEIDAYKLLDAKKISEVSMEVQTGETDLKNGTVITLTLTKEEYDEVVKTIWGSILTVYKLKYAVLSDDFVIDIQKNGKSVATEGPNPKLDELLTWKNQEYKQKIIAHANKKDFEIKYIVPEGDDYSEVFSTGEYPLFESGKYEIEVKILNITKKSKTGFKVPDFSKNGNPLFFDSDNAATPVLYVNDALLDDYTYWNRQINARTSNTKVISSQIGFVDILSEDERIKFNSDRTKFVQNTLTIEIQEMLKGLNSFLQDKANNPSAKSITNREKVEQELNITPAKEGTGESNNKKDESKIQVTPANSQVISNNSSTKDTSRNTNRKKSNSEPITPSSNNSKSQPTRMELLYSGFDFDAARTDKRFPIPEKIQMLAIEYAKLNEKTYLVGKTLVLRALIEDMNTFFLQKIAESIRNGDLISASEISSIVKAESSDNEIQADNFMSKYSKVGNVLVRLGQIPKNNAINKIGDAARVKLDNTMHSPSEFASEYELQSVEKEAILRFNKMLHVLYIDNATIFK